MTRKDRDTIIESIVSIKNRIDKHEGRERHAFLVACRANIRLSRFFKSKHQFTLLPEYEEYSRFVEEQLQKYASPLPTIAAPSLQIQP